MEVKLVVIGGKSQGREIPITETEFIIGRGENCHLRPASDRVSRKHCAIYRKEGQVTVIDFGSTNHTYVNDEQVVAERELKNGDRLKVGVLEFEVQLAVSVGGKTKPKVHSIQEAAARTVETKAAKDDDIDITCWLEEKEDEEEDTPNQNRLPEKPSMKDTHVTAHKLTDTTTIHVPHKEDEASKSGSKITKHPAGKFAPPKKPIGENSQDAANDMLRQFFNRKKP
jgi:pSer/pThr/pTyr-binding forkhead associated (FHA) protein